MSIPEVAQSFNVDESTVRRYISKVFPDKIKNGLKTWLDEKEVTAIKLKLQQNQHLVRPADLPKTDLEKRLLVRQAMDILNEEIDELKNQLTEARPKIEFHDQVGDSEGLYSIGETAKLIGTGRNKFFKRLREEKIFMGTLPYQSFIDRGYFEVKTSTHNDHVQKQAFCTPKGLQWIHEKFTGLKLDGSLVKQIK